MFKYFSLAATFFVFLSASVEAAPTTIYVSVDGNDSWTGTCAKPAQGDGPFRTLERARDAIRQRKAAGGLAAGGVVVEVAGGTYCLDKPFELTASDSGTPECPITYRAQPGAEVRLVGGRVVSNFAPVNDPSALARLDETARGHVLQADLKAAGVTDLGKQDWSTSKGGAGLELFYQDRPMTLARWPNNGFTPIVNVAGPIVKNTRGQDVCREGLIVYEGDRPSRWVKEPDGWVHGYWFHDWSDQRHPIASIDVERHVLAVKPPYHSYGYRKDRWFYAFNLLPELDSPGEWYLDRAAGMLYFWPPETAGGVAAGHPMVSVVETLIAMQDVSHVTIRGFTLEACRATGGDHPERDGQSRGGLRDSEYGRSGGANQRRHAKRRDRLRHHRHGAGRRIDRRGRPQGRSRRPGCSPRTTTSTTTAAGVACIMQAYRAVAWETGWPII